MSFFYEIIYDIVVCVYMCLWGGERGFIIFRRFLKGLVIFFVKIALEFKFIILEIKRRK